MLFDRFDSLRIISLPYRKDRRKEMTRELRKVGRLDDQKVSFFDAIRPADKGDFPSIGARGCYLSHMAVLEEAAREAKSVLILEDDVNFLPALNSYELPEKWEIFYGGYVASDPASLETSDIIGAHFMGFTAKMAGKVAAYLRMIMEDDDPQRCLFVDGTYVWFRRAHPEVVTVFSEEQLGYQRPSRTDLHELRFFDRMPGVRALAGMVRTLKRSGNPAPAGPSWTRPSRTRPRQGAADDI